MDLESPAPLLAEVFRTPRQRRAQEHSLVLSARSIPHFLEHHGPEFVLLVPEWRAEDARAELEAYRRENSFQRRVRELPRDWLGGLTGGTGYLLAVVALTHLAWIDAGGLGWTERGLADAPLMLGGEWWRAVTALTLHADLAHLAGNMLFGALFATLLCQEAGFGLGWLLLVLGGAIGNAINAAFAEDGHRSLGASTMVFAALGALIALELVQRRRTRERAWRRWAPLIAGLILFSWLGTGPRDPSAMQPTDTGAHLAGFAAGLLLALAAVPLVQRARGASWTRRLCALAAAAIVAGAWVLALGLRLSQGA